MSAVKKLFARLSPTGDISDQCITGTIISRVGPLAGSVVHVKGQFYSWDTKPKFWGCRFFYANGRFIEIAGTPLMKLYNAKNKDKIQEFDSIEELEKWISNG